MTRYEFAKQVFATLYQCHLYGIEVRDWVSVQVYEDILRMRANGEKMEYCVNVLADKYNISVARVWRIIRKMRSRV